MNSFITHKDAVILTILISSPNKMSLVEIMINYDLREHAIITAEEINYTLCVLSKYLSVSKNKKMYAKKEAVLLKTKMFEKYSFNKQSEIVYKKLLKETKLDNIEVKQYFTENDIEKTYKKYINQ